MIAIDALVRRFKENDTTFYRGYKSARSVKNLGERKTKIPEVTENQQQK
ncbi:MAG: hypothetical protein IPL67_03715 [Ignavibacteria bacterium]|nr:hypothetical protein [Ignavibacteria bacterium]